MIRKLSFGCSPLAASFAVLGLDRRHQHHALHAEPGMLCQQGMIFPVCLLFPIEQRRDAIYSLRGLQKGRLPIET